MLSIDGRTSRTCAGMTRRRMLSAGGAGLLGLSLPKVWSAERVAQRFPRRAKSVIFLFLFGGPSQYETFDMKPQAPAEIRGPFRPIASRTPGLQICEHLPKLANVSDKFAVIRTMSHSYNDHSGAAHYMQTGRRWQIPVGGGFAFTPDDWPSMGSVAEYLKQQQPHGLESELPGYMVVPNRLGRLQDSGQYLRPGEYAGWLGQAFNPLTTRVDKRDLSDNPYWRDCSDKELTYQIEGLTAVDAIQLDRIRRRVSLLEQFDTQRRLLDQQDDRQLALLTQRALGLVTSEKTRLALDVRQESARVRDAYGRHLFGQSTLLARRLVEAGVQFVTVHYDACDGYSWDSHVHSRDVRDHLLPTFDQTLSALIVDLEERGMLDETLVVAVGEMGRTPQPTPEWGRGHWSTLFPAVLAGGGIRGGALYGRSDKNGTVPEEGVVHPEDLAATIYYAMGIDPEYTLQDRSGRPVPLVADGHPVMALFG